MRVEIDDKSGFCFGVVRAISEAEKALAEGSTVYSLGDIVHNRIEVQRLERLGLRTVTHADMPALGGRRLFIRAHGELKIFMTADPRVRACRRYDELRAKGDPVSLEEIERNVRERDKADMGRAISPLRQAEDAIVLDNSCMTVGEQMAWFRKEFEQVTR